MSNFDEDSKQSHNMKKEELSGILETVGERVPKLIRDVIGSLYSKEAGTNMGQAVGAYYKELIDSGIPQEAALDMAKEFAFSMKNINFSDDRKHD
jgi:hypothetical protein